MLRRAAGACASSVLFKRGRDVWARNREDFNLSLSKIDKLWSGGYLILSDYAQGIFPPTFDDERAAHENEARFAEVLPGVDLDEAYRLGAIKPLWDPTWSAKYLGEFNRLFATLQGAGVQPGARLLEPGCGSGWMAELFAQAGYSVVGVTIAEHDVVLAQRKADAHRAKRLSSELSFRQGAMEYLDQMPDLREFDAVYIYEALHHAYDWRKTLRAAAKTLRVGGRLVIANEPNRLHTAISYRVAKLSNTHEIGFSKPVLLRELRAAGFEDIRVLSPRWDNWVSVFWIVASKSA